MLSMPPATMMSALPATRRSCASMAASIAEPHILLTVMQPVPRGRPAFSAAWRAGACPCPAGSTQPMIAWSTHAGSTLARAIAALITTLPRSLADRVAKSPWRPPIGVRAAPTIAIGSFCIGSRVLVLRSASVRSVLFSGTRRGARRLACAPRPAHQLPAAIRADPVQRIRAGRAERALVTADVRSIVVGGKRPRATFAALAHFQSHVWFPGYFVSLKISRPISIRRISEVPWVIWPWPPLRDLTFAPLMLASSDRPKAISSR